MVLFVLTAWQSARRWPVGQLLEDDERHIRWHQEGSMSTLPPRIGTSSGHRRDGRD